MQLRDAWSNKFLWLSVGAAAAAAAVVVVLTLTRIIKSVVTGQAPVTLELRNGTGAP